MRSECILFVDSHLSDLAVFRLTSVAGGSSQDPETQHLHTERHTWSAAIYLSPFHTSVCFSKIGPLPSRSNLLHYVAGEEWLYVHSVDKVMSHVAGLGFKKGK